MVIFSVISLFQQQQLTFFHLLNPVGCIEEQVDVSASWQLTGL